jgi:hypothetical protein
MTLELSKLAAAIRHEVNHSKEWHASEVKRLESKIQCSIDFREVRDYEKERADMVRIYTNCIGTTKRLTAHLIHFLKEKPSFDEERFWKDCGFTI